MISPMLVPWRAGTTISCIVYATSMPCTTRVVIIMRHLECGNNNDDELCLEWHDLQRTVIKLISETRRWDNFDREVNQRCLCMDA